MIFEIEFTIVTKQYRALFQKTIPHQVVSFFIFADVQRIGYRD